MQGRDYVEIWIASIAVVALTILTRILVVSVFKQSPTLASIITFGISGFLMSVVARRIIDRRQRR
jgi:hypothetical protein